MTHTLQMHVSLYMVEVHTGYVGGNGRAKQQNMSEIPNKNSDPAGEHLLLMWKTQSLALTLLQLD